MNTALSLANGVALMACIALFYGYVQRSGSRRWMRHVVLGLWFGLGAALSMFQPFLQDGGYLIDGRSLFIGFAAAFLSGIGLSTALAVAVLTRMMLGGDGALIGCSSMLIAGGMGMLWSAVRERNLIPGVVSFTFLGVAISVAAVTMIFLPMAIRPSALQTLPTVILYHLAGSILFGTLLQRERDNARREREMVNDAMTDPLTGLLNRRALPGQFSNAARILGSKGTAMLVVDLDHFKAINDRYGHDAGDLVLRAVAGVLSQTIRSQDTVVRFGGEEFVVLLPDVNENGAAQAAWRICQQMRMGLRLDDGQVVQVSASVGVGFAPVTDQGLDVLLKTADQALYDAKRQGRDRVVMRSLPMPEADQDDVFLPHQRAVA
ncbi:MAG TPA: GGDEF domain-containing protein [Gemmobacter sp.]|nr:MAG: hypothetical protein A2X69_15050 [Rhodobacteraceae bacterium GWF1_65_7]HBD91405.1 GGDEF domain-containing protein [Gemmobacter sp.]HBU16660.1 GGDEF domain-containing protein [Gemmobacter sp.]